MKNLVTGGILAALMLVAWTPALARDNFALLIGASEYPNLDKRFWLRGPRNDVDLVRTYLMTNPHVPFDAANITLLADGLDGAAAPTLSAIREQMAKLAERAGNGDFVYLHFSGHGSQMPARDMESELDGLDEIFLPTDIGPWNDNVAAVENALVDDEIGKMIDAIRAKGASVWAVFDSCHSGTVTRAVAASDDDVRLRKLPPAALDVPEDLTDGIQTRALPLRQSPQSPVDASGSEGGAYVAFFAAQTNETTPEKRLPRGMPGRRSQGVFTYTLFEALAEHPGITYRQLGHEVLRRYAVKNLARSTPMFEGDLDAPVFGTRSQSGVLQWPLTAGDGRLDIAAGQLHGLSTGTRLAVLASPADEIDAALGFARVEATSNFTATVVPIAAASRPQLALADIPQGAYVRRIEQRLSFGLRVALPPAIGAPAEALMQALKALAKDDIADARISFVPSEDAADLRIAVLPDSPRPDALWVLPQTGLIEMDQLAQTPSISTSGKSPGEIGPQLLDMLTRMSRVQSILKLGGAFQDTELNVDLALRTRSPANRKLSDLQTLPVPRLIPKDEVHVLAENNEDVPIDLNVLYVGSDYSITHMYKGRLQPGDSLKKGILRITDTAFGRDRVIMILTPAEDRTAVEDLSFLEQDELELTRAAAPGSFRDLLGQAGFGSATRAAARMNDDVGELAPAIVQFAIDTVPAK